MKSAADHIRESAQGFSIIGDETAARLMAIGARWAFHVVQVQLLESGAKSAPTALLLEQIAEQQNAIDALAKGGK